MSVIHTTAPTARPSHPSKTARLSADATLEARRSPELVIGLVGAVGSGVSTVASILQSQLKEDYDYEKVEVIKASRFIEKASSLVSEPYDSNLKGAERIEQLQFIGNKLRKKYSNDYIMEKCIEKIAMDRLDKGYDKEQDVYLPLPLRQAHVIDSLKHPDEVQLLRDVYGDVFWLIAIFAPEKQRKKRLEGQGVKDKALVSIFHRDENEDIDHGQKVRDTTHLADFFVRNDGENDRSVRSSIFRFLEILFGSSIHTPTRHEAGMYAASSASSQSACMSRQVGASIYSKDGEFLSVGWNDVPKFGGGLYTEENGVDDHRCYMWRQGICHNDDRKKKLYNEIYESLSEANILSEETRKEAVIQSLRKTSIRNLLEFSRSVHAEMEAIMAVARSGAGGLRGASLYSTTFPCHNCARHIVASGISEVYFIEPYAKSLATDLHDDSIERGEAPESKVAFLQYEGVAPKNILKLFKHGESRKESGKRVSYDKKKAKPVFCPAIDGYTTHEQMVVARLESKEGLAENGHEGGMAR